MSKEPRDVLDSIWAFPPNRETFGGTAYFIVGNFSSSPQPEFRNATPVSTPDTLQNAKPTGSDQNYCQNVLIDCPSWDDGTQAFLQKHGGVQHLVITHRQGASPAAASIQALFGCQIWVQEQEAYLLTEGVIASFQDSVQITDHLQVFWTCGYSPGSACVYDARQGGVLFTGRHLLPDPQGNPAPLKTAKTFHWPRQIRSVRDILRRFDEQSLRYLCPGANTGFLRQQRFIDDAYRKLARLDLSQLDNPVEV